MENSDALVAAERARQDFEDIAFLKGNDAFNRYWLRRLAQKRTEAEKRFKYDPPEKVNKDQREELRQQLLVLEDLEKMMELDAGNIKAGVRR